MRTARLLTFILLALAIAGCSSTPAAKQPVPEAVAPGPAATTTSKHPWAKFIELAGFRLSEAGTGKLAVKFIAVNHSEADFSELTLKIRLKTSVAKPGDPPLAEFEAKVPPLAPLEVKDVSLTFSSKLRGYEIPDWQYLRTEFDILAPQP